MAHTVVGIFEYESDAQEAQNYLLANGFADGDVDFKTATYKSETDAPSVIDRDGDFGDRIGNFFKDLFDGDDDQTRRYTDAGRRGTIVTVHAASAEEAQAAAAILDEYGAIDLDQSTADRSSNPGYTQPVTDASFVEGPSTVPVIEEELHLGKREVETGGVRLRSRVVERPVQESIRLRQEQVSVNRTPVDRIATESDFETFKEGTIEVKEYAEVPVVSKEARVVEEISLNKSVEERDEIVSDTVRHTEVDVEDITDEERLRRAGLDL
ncbi:YsnF/AvaK domain-containing protein [Dyadobacter chenwenxiniae]|uniref:YsnF/AvaK domain-containing protein n=1 Tax=Dyadobacter chenwenxiniae TaxID=2906456 RepID=A0A9X1PS05_9BACT|nr:YsnF/AvaK domain-containing protein [Dyadobacter chenwenxiniae]MCF0054115.1 YsnF/AvaK domain-containing protein [Dyadobacter chenwenxiniae]MCF0064593.1 YsnF/AvaK domain-containing protein [Dyadobacter chenwenxiniae]UON84349.1 YsnF/AvaK domain-containing protein [Dyadobacter chenwenxiniae]